MDEAVIGVSKEAADWAEKAFTINVSMHVAVDGPVWVVKKDGGYARQAGLNWLQVKSKRLATRFDSATWAAHFAVQLGGKVVRLLSKAEKEARAVSGKTWTKTYNATATVPNVPVEQACPAPDETAKVDDGK